MNPVDLKYINMLSPKLERYNVKSNNPFKANFRCPLCGDSQKSKTKARGWLVEEPQKNFVYYNCFNCEPTPSPNLQAFLRIVSPSLAEEYVTEKFFNKDKKENIGSVGEIKKYEVKTKPLIKISKLPHTHRAKKYIENRKIPSDQHHKIYYVKDFNGWVNSIIPNKLPDRKESRIVVPLRDENKKTFGVTGRSLKDDDKSLRYITIMFDSSKVKVYGLEYIDFTTKYYVTEGAFDSLFLKNSLAMSGGSLDYSVLQNPMNGTFVYDNEPRNKEIVRKMYAAVDYGASVCIWPSRVKGKDINDMVLNGMSRQEISSIIDTNSLNGLEAKFELDNWRKIKI